MSEQEHVISVAMGPSVMYANTTARVVTCTCGWVVTRYSAKLAEKSVSLHSEAAKREAVR